MALEVVVGAALLKDAGIDQRQEIVRALAHGEIDYGDPRLDPHLGSCQSDPRRCVHRSDQVFDEFREILVELVDRPTARPQHGVRVDSNRQDSHRRELSGVVGEVRVESLARR